MTQELIMKKLESMGYRPQIDKDGDIAFMYQMRQLFIVSRNIEEDPYVLIYQPELAAIEEGEELLTFAACNDVTRDSKVIKIYVDPNMETVSSSCEFFFTDDSFDLQLSMALKMLGVVRKVFLNRLSELKDAANGQDDDNFDNDDDDDDSGCANEEFCNDIE